jgi:hypothetical protein
MDRELQAVRRPALGMGVVMTALGMGRNAYWRFLCRTYGMGALEAWQYIARVGLPPTAERIRVTLTEKAA